MTAGRSELRWRKSSYSTENSDNCVETASLGCAGVAVRDSKCVGAAGYDVVTVSAASWEAFARYIAL
ncbi:DUF397 domain-containing protein [Streptomyces sp. BI20]|uniref:DUF397 domain-containing protein n=1 Tax=Streptomyces sp. BI20 TaxID=3403460 RepID=UPI003C751929